MIRRAAVGVAILAYALVFGEMFLRLLDPQPLVPRYVTGSADGVRANMPNVAFRQWTPEVDVTVRYNAAGMRDDRPPPPLAKRAGECRIVLLGDSFFVGFESDYQSSFAKQLEDRLRGRGHDCRVLDFAVSGFGTAEMLVALKARALRWQPDLVVMSWHATDPVDNVRSGLFGPGPDGQLAPTGAVFLPGTATSDTLMGILGYRWLIENSHLYSAVRERAGVFTKSLLARRQVAALNGDAGLPPEDPDNGTPPDPMQRRPGSPELDAALILSVRDTARSVGAELLLVDIPARRTRTEFLSLFDWLPPVVFENVATVDPVSALRAAAGPDRPMYLERGQRHWTTAGNAVVAQVVVDEIVRRRLLARPAGTG